MIESYTVHMTSKKEQCLVLCLTLVGVSKIPSYIVATSFVILHALALHLSIVGCHEDAFAVQTWSIATIEVVVRIVHKLTIVND